MKPLDGCRGGGGSRVSPSSCFLRDVVDADSSEMRRAKPRRCHPALRLQWTHLSAPSPSPRVFQLHLLDRVGWQAEDRAGFHGRDQLHDAGGQGGPGQ